MPATIEDIQVCEGCREEWPCECVGPHEDCTACYGWGWTVNGGIQTQCPTCIGNGWVALNDSSRKDDNPLRWAVKEAANA